MLSEFLVELLLLLYGRCGIELVQDVLHLAPQLVDLPALNGDTPLHVACLWNKRNTARLLVALGAQEMGYYCIVTY